MRGKLRKFGILVLVVAIIAQPTVGSAAAASAGGANDECSLSLVEAAEAFVTFGYSLAYDAGQCEERAQANDETAADARAVALGAGETGEVATTLTQNELSATKSLMWCKVEAKTAKMVANNSTKSETKSNVSAMIADHYSRLQTNLIKTHNSQLAQVYYAYNTSRLVGLQDSSTDEGLVLVNYPDPGSYLTNDLHIEQNDDVSADPWSVAENTTLVNGTNTTYQSYDGPEDNGIFPFGKDYDADYGDGYYPQIWVAHPENVPSGATYPNNQHPTDSNPKAVKVYDAQSWNTTWNDLIDQEQFIQDNADQLIDAAYNDSQNFSEIPSDELLSACSLSLMSGNDESTGQYSYVRGTLATAGISHDVNASWSISYTPAAGQTFRGDTSITLSTQNANVTNLSVGSDAILAGGETVGFDAVADSATLYYTLNGTTYSTTAEQLSNGRWQASFVPPASEDGPHDVQFWIGTNVSGTEHNTSKVNATFARNGGASVNLSGGLFTDWAPSKTNGTFENGTTYDTANANAPVYFAAATSDLRDPLYTLNGEFTVTALTNPKTGESLNNTTLQNETHQTVDTDINKSQVQKLLDYRNQWKDNFNIGSTGGGGGGLFGGVSLGGGIAGAAIALGAIFLLLGNRP